MTIQGTIEKAAMLLRKNYFEVSTFSGTNSCFDLIARSSEKTILIKAYDNIDSIRKEQGEELKKLGQVLEATCLIIGEKTKVFSLKNDTVYYRYDIPTITLETFEQILDRETPKMRYFKGKYIVDIDFEELKKKRQELELSLDELSQKIGVAADTLHRFEKGASTSLETAEKLEEELHKELTRGINVFERKPIPIGIDEAPSEKLLEKIHDLGVRMALFSHSPFKAYGMNDHGLLIGTGKGKFDIPKKALELKKTRTVIKKDSLIITKEYKYKSVEGIPVIQESELETISRAKDLKKIIEERENEEK